MYYANDVLDMDIRWPQTWWVILVPGTTTDITSFITMAYRYTKLWIYLFTFLVISQWEQICKWGIYIPFGDDRPCGYVVHVAITTHIKFHQCTIAHTELWIFYLFVISQSEQICKWGNKYVHLVTTDQVGQVPVPITTHISVPSM